jgi:hypothetical protein
VRRVGINAIPVTWVNDGFDSELTASHARGGKIDAD